MTHIGLFEGIGGFSLAARWMGWETKAWCEWNEFGQQVLKYHFPEAEGHGDITKTDFTKYANTIDILTGGFPCQPYSQAGKRLGKEDERHLFPEMLRAIREVQPCYVVGENVSGLTNWNGGMVFDEVQADLETEGYEVLPFLLPACGVGAPHRRDRIWFIAYSNRNNDRRNTRKNEGEGCKERIQERIQERQSAKPSEVFGIATDTGLQRQAERQEQSMGAEQLWKERDVTNTSDKGLQRGKVNGGFGSVWQERNEQFTGLLQPTWEKFPTQSPLCGGDDGLSRELDGITFSKWRTESIKAYGNAIVPQVALQIFRAIEEMEQDRIKGAWAKTKNNCTGA